MNEVSSLRLDVLRAPYLFFVTAPGGIHQNPQRKEYPASPPFSHPARWDAR